MFNASLILILCSSQKPQPLPHAPPFPPLRRQGPPILPHIFSRLRLFFQIWDFPSMIELHRGA